MLKKLMYLLPFFVIGMSFNAVAVPSAGSLAKNKSNVTVAKTAAITPKRQSGMKTSTVRATQNLEAQSVKTDSATAAARFPTLSKIKQSNKNPINNTGTNTNTNTKPTSVDVSADSFNSLVQRVEVLESQNANGITDVVEQGSGAFVNDIQKENNKLNVSKTHLLYAPVKTAGSETVSGNAEIWIIK